MIGKKNKLFENTIMLYMLTFSNYFFSFISVPYQTRILGAEIYGKLGFAVAFMSYFQLFLDFGFLLSATETVALYRNDKIKLSRILSSVCWCKMILTLISGAILIGLCLSVTRFSDDVLLYVLYFVSVAINSFMPDYLYRGLEEMRIITIRTVLIKLFFTCAIFVFLKNPEQYYIVPILNILGNGIALMGVYIHVKKNLKLKLVKVTMKEVWDMMKKSSTFFYSRIASSVYSATNTFIMGFIYGDNSAVVGYFTSADKLITTGKQGITPICDSLYPYMVRKRDFKFLKKIMYIGIPIMTVGCAGVMIFAEPICTIIFGADFSEAGKYLRALAPTVWCSFPAMMLGFPVLSPMGLAKYANISNVFGAVIQIIELILLFLIGELNALTICLATCITEIATLIFRATVVWIYRDRLKGEEQYR